MDHLPPPPPGRTAAMARAVADDLSSIFGEERRADARPTTEDGAVDTFAPAVCAPTRRRGLMAVGVASLIGATVVAGILAGRSVTTVPSTPQAQVAAPIRPSRAVAGPIAPIAVSPAPADPAPLPTPPEVLATPPAAIPATPSAPIRTPVYEQTSDRMPAAPPAVAEAPPSPPPIATDAPSLPPQAARDERVAAEDGGLADRFARADRQLDDAFDRAFAAGVEPRTLRAYDRERARARRAAAAQPGEVLHAYAMMAADLRLLAADAADRR